LLLRLMRLMLRMRWPCLSKAIVLALVEVVLLLLLLLLLLLIKRKRRRRRRKGGVVVRTRVVGG